jgi:putative spermidine/putrescine transport system permease protein
LALFTICACVFLFAPVLAIIPLSFSAGSFFHFPLPGLSVRWYEALFSSPVWVKALGNTLFVGTCATGLATFLGTLAAFGLWKSDLPGKPFIQGLLISPMVMPVIVVGVSAYYSFAQLELNNSYTGLILIHAVLGSPFVLVTVSASLASFNETLLKAAASLGASPSAAFLHVVLPIILPGVLSGAVFALAASVDDVVIALFVAGPEQLTLPRQMFLSSSDNFELTITAAATVMLVFSAALMAAAEMLRRRTEKLRNATP